MYYEDYMHPTQDNDVNSVDLKNNTFLNNLKTTERDCLRVKKRVVLNDGREKNVAYELYGSKGVGTKIRNAVTGSKTNYLVGSRYEDLFFKVTESSGTNGRKDPLQLYYDSPEQYENHCFVKLDPEDKAYWHRKNLLARKELDV
jgi:hypothetical protein